MPSKRVPGRATWDRMSTPTRVAALVIAVHLVVRAWLVLPAEYWQDDFVVLQAVRDGFPSVDTLFWDRNGHITPAMFVAGWVLEQVSGSFLPAALLVLAMQAAVSIVLWLLLRRAVGDRMSAVVGLAAALFTPLMFSTVTWWSAAVAMLAQQLAMVAAGYCHLRYLDSRSWWWVAGGVGAMVFGLLFIEKAVFVPVFLVLLTLVTRYDGLRRTAVLLLRLWPVWLVHAVVAAAYLVLYLRLASLGGGNIDSVGGAVDLVRHQLVDVFGRGMLGGPWTSVFPGTSTWLPASAAGVALVLQVFVAVAVLAYRVSGARSVVAWAVLGFYLAFNLGLTLRGRGLFANLIEFDPRYVADSTLLAAVCLAVMFNPREGRPVRIPEWWAQRSTVVACVAVLALFNSSMLTAGRLGDALHHDEVSTYVENARLATLKDPRLVLYDGSVPQSIMIGLFRDEEKRVSSVLAAYDVHPRYDLPSSRMRILDESGVARPIALTFAQSARLRDSDCGQALRPGRTAFVDLDGTVGEGRWLMRLDYFAGSDSVVDVQTSAGDPTTVGLPRGRRTVFVSVEGGRSFVEISRTRGDGVVCLTGLTIGVPAPVAE